MRNTGDVRSLPTSDIELFADDVLTDPYPAYYGERLAPHALRTLPATGSRA
jgi:hypothetical protein